MSLNAAVDSQLSSDATDTGSENRTDFETMFREHYDRVYSLAYRLCGDRTEAEDVAQETFLKAARGWFRFRGEAQPWSWLYRVTVNTAADAHKRNRRAVRTIQGYASATPDGNNRREKDARDDPAERLRRALVSLPIRQRAAIVLTVCEGLSHRKAAHILGCSETTVSWHVHRAKKALGRIMTGGENHE